MTRRECFAGPWGNRRPHRTHGGAKWILTVLAFGCALGALWSTWGELPVRAVYNASDSVPTGWYRIDKAGSVEVGDVVLVRLPAGAAEFAASRHYLPPGVPLLKSVFARSGQSVCVVGTWLLVDGAAVAQALARDRAGRTMPRWKGCRELNDDELLLLSPAHAESFDGRYFGPIKLDAVLGKANPLHLGR